MRTVKINRAYWDGRDDYWAAVQPSVIRVEDVEDMGKLVYLDRDSPAFLEARAKYEGGTVPREPARAAAPAPSTSTRKPCGCSRASRGGLTRRSS
jgi:hypothetical protein